MTSKISWTHLAGPLAALTLACLAPTPARADFFDDMRKTFTVDIPHFFQDDIPCAFGGQPTSHTKTSCNSKSPPARPATTGNAPVKNAVEENPTAPPPPAPSQDRTIEQSPLSPPPPGSGQ